MQKYILLFILPLFTTTIKGTDTEVTVANDTDKILGVSVDGNHIIVKVPADTREIGKSSSALI